MNALNNCNKIDSEYSQAPTDDLFTFWRSKVKVTAGCRGQILWMPCLMNYRGNLDDTHKE